MQTFLIRHPTKSIKVNSHICEYEHKTKLFSGYENMQIQEGCMEGRKWKERKNGLGEILSILTKNM